MPELSFTVITALWNRPALLPKLIQSVQLFDYPRAKFTHLLLDDSGQLDNQSGPGWQIVGFNRPFVTLPEKMNAMLGMVTTDAVMIAEDDDEFLSHSLQAHNAALQDADVSKPSKVLSWYGGKENVEDSAGRFHSSIAFRAEPVRKLGGWIATQRADFDQMFLARLRDNLRVADYVTLGHVPAYRFNWDRSGHSHGQSAMRGPNDTEWLTRAREAAGPISYVGELFPRPRHAVEPREIDLRGSFDGEA